MNFFKSVSSSSGVIDPVHALPGRDKPLKISGRHLINGSSMKPPFPTEMETIIFGMGCFWGAERLFWQVPGVYTTAAGYSGGTTPNPTYAETCTSRTGHTEAVLVVFNPIEVKIETLFKVFWENHDPTQYMGQGNDIGTQYRTAIYTTTEYQIKSARESLKKYQELLSNNNYGSITTEISEACEFYYAEEEHQQYLAKNPWGYCNHGFCQIAYD